MKKILFFSIITLIITSACKKGANDPSISLRTRKARVVGEWTIASGTSTYSTTDVFKATTQERYSFTENEYNYVGTDENNLNYTAKGLYFFKMKFEKDGKVTITETYDNQTTTINGTWNFNAGIGKNKSKEQIIIHVTYVSYPIGATKILGNQTDITYTLTELRNKKMSLYQEYKEEKSDNSALSIVNSYEMKQ